MLDARKAEGRNSESSGGSSSGMDDAEIASHSIVFFLAGYETTANALTFISYLLASHPHVQEKLQQEIDSYYLQHQVCVCTTTANGSVSCKMYEPLGLLSSKTCLLTAKQTNT